MQFALVNGNRTKPRKGLNGVCPGCLQPVIPKCGEQRIHHWAHIGDFVCNAFREAETEWHLSWKSYFNDDWLEKDFKDEQTGEIHIADVFTDHGLVIEFQHSHINSEECASRESFYKDMVWVVDGTRLKRDFNRFLKGIEGLRNTGLKNIFTVAFPEECFNSSWVSCKVPVVFDFLGTSSEDTIDDNRRRYLYCLLPKQKGQPQIMAVFSREGLINSFINGEFGRIHTNNTIQNNRKPQKGKSRNRNSSHFYDAKKGRFIKKRRF